MKPARWLWDHRVKLALGIVLLVVSAWVYHEYGDDLTRDDIIRYGRRLHLVWFLLAFLILPLVGFPISILLVLAGIRFGLTGGMTLAAAGVFFHNFVAYRMTHSWFRKPLTRWLQRKGHRIPPIKQGHQAWFTALFAAIHGPPYFAKLYLLALTDIPFRTYFWVGAPVYIFFCIVPVGAGSAVLHLDPVWIWAFGGLMVLLLLAGEFVRRRYGRDLAADGE